MTKPFDETKHEARVAEYYRQQADFKAFDRLIDMALEGEISVQEAIVAFEGNGLTPIEGQPESD